MGTSLAGLLPQNTYSGLLKFGDNAALSATLRAISDGAGNDTMLSISTTALQIGGATGLNWDNTNKRLGVGTNAPSATGHFKGSGSTSATTSLLVQNSAATPLLGITDDGIATMGTNATNNAALLFQRPNVGVNGVFWGDDFVTNIYGSITLSRATGEMRMGAAKASYFVTFYSGVAERMRLVDGGLVIGGTSLNASAGLQVDSTTKGFLPPRMTTTQKNAIASPASGLEMYDSTAKSPAYYDGTNWGYTGGALQNTTGNGGTLNVSFAAGNIVNLTLNATTTLTFANAVIGTYIVQVTQSAGGGSSLVYPASVKWAGGTAPTLSTAVGKTDILTFYHDGTNYYGTYSLNY